MSIRSHRLRRVAVAILGSIAAVSSVGVLGSGTAGASGILPSAAAVTAVTLPANATPATVVPGVASQAATNWTFQLANTFASGDNLTIDLPACQSATNFVGFAAVPTVSVVTNSTTGTTEAAPIITAAVATQSTDAAACKSAATADQLVLTFTNSASTGSTAWTVTLSGIRYTVGSAVPPGAVAATGSYNENVTIPVPATVSVASNATVPTYSITANNPSVGLAPGGTDQAISNLVITEYKAGVLTGTVTVTLPTGNTFNATSTPTVTASGGGGVAGNVTGMGSATLTFSVTTPSSSAPATYTLSGLAVDAQSGTGPVTASVSGSGGAVTGSPQVFSVIGSNRIFGQTAVDTSAVLFQDNGCNTNAVLATSDNYPDALSAGYLAGQLGTSVLITPTAAVSSATLNALRLEGVSSVFVVGGPLAVSPADIATLQSTDVYSCGGTTTVQGAVGPQTLSVVQISGQTQYGTAQQVAEYPGPAGVGSVRAPGAYGGTYNDTTGANGTAAGSAPTAAVSTAILAVGTNYPDAMAASALSYQAHLPVLLTETSSLAPEAQAAIANLGIHQVIVMGGPLAISDSVLTQLEGLGVSTFRIAGQDYTDTAQLLARFELSYANASGVVDGLGLLPNPAVGLTVSRGDDFQDALSASAFAGTNRSPILLTEDPNTVGQYLTGFLNAAGTTGVGVGGYNYYRLTILGGPLAVTNATVAALTNALAAG